MASAGFQLYDAQGARKYFTDDERQAFLRAAEDQAPEVRTFCHVLVWTGCRLSEGRALTADRVDLEAGTVIFESLKKRSRGIYRSVPVPPALLDTLNLVHGIRAAQKARDRGASRRLWPWSRATAWRRVHAVIEAAGVTGPHANPKGLRHGFGIAAIQANVPLNMIQKWLGHASLATTALYADAVGPEEQSIAARMW